MSTQLQIFPLTDGGQWTANSPTDDLHGFASQEEYDENLQIWFEVMMQNEREEEEDLQIWFEIMMEREREQDEEFRQEMFLYMDSVFENDCPEVVNELKSNKKKPDFILATEINVFEIQPVFLKSLTG